MVLWVRWRWSSRTGRREWRTGVGRCCLSLSSRRATGFQASSPRSQGMSQRDVIREAMATNDGSRQDDRLTVISVSALGCILQDILHEGLGHGVTAWLSGARQVTMSTVALQSDIETRWVSANGTLVNLLFGGIFWLLLLKPQRYRPTLRYFLVLAMAGNLFTGTGYFFFSGVSNFGDWAAVIDGLHPHWIWRLGLVALGVASYYASMLLVAAKLSPFRSEDPAYRRLRGLSWTPYFA